MGWVKYSTVGATWNSDIGSQPADTAITNSRIKISRCLIIRFWVCFTCV